MRLAAVGILALALALAGACSAFESSENPGGSSGSPDGSSDADLVDGDRALNDGAADAEGGSLVDGLASGVLNVRAGGQFGCALHAAGTVSCWGRNNEGQVGQPALGDLACDDPIRCRPTPIAVPGLANVTQISGGQLFACARTADGSVLCWGANDFATLGMGNAGSPQATPTVVPGLPHAIDVAAGSFNACARVDGNSGSSVDVYCWGTNREGMLGSAATNTTAGPTLIPALSGAKSVVLSRASEHGCAIRADDSVVCWGKNLAGSIGHDEGAASDLDSCPGGGYCNHIPSVVGDTSFKAGEIALGLSFGCARSLGTNAVSCWGYNALASLGLGFSDTQPHSLPSPINSLTNTSSIACGGTQACALVGGVIHCWGGNSLGELGNGNLSDSCILGACKLQPDTVLNLKNVIRINAGFNATFATTADGTEWSWGGNPDGRLGHAPGTSNDLLKCGASNTGRCNPLPQPFTIP